MLLVIAIGVKLILNSFKFKPAKGNASIETKEDGYYINNSKATEEESEDEDTSEDEELTLCANCGNKVTDLNECEECGESICEDCSIGFENIGIDICKSCIDNAYPRGTITREKIVEKIVEKPVYLNPTTEEPIAEIDEHEFD